MKNTQLNFEFESDNNKKYKIEGIQNNTVYTKKIITG